MGRLITFAVSVFCVALLSALLPVTAAAQTGPVRAVWMYGFESSFNNATEVGYLSAMGINQVYLSMGSISAHKKIDQSDPGYSTTYTYRLSDFITRANAAGIRVHAMTLEDPDFTLTQNHALGEVLIGNILSYNAHNPLARFDGIHINVESWNPSLWQSGDLNDLDLLLDEFLGLLSWIRNQVDTHETVYGQSIVISFSVAWWFNEQADAGALPNGDAGLLSTYVDVLVPLVYDGVGSTFDGIVSRVDDEISEAPTVIGIGSHEFSSCYETQNIQSGLDEYYSQTPDFLGTSVFKYAHLKNECIASPVVSGPVRISGSPPVYYQTVQEAYDNALDGDTIEIQNIVFIEDLYIDDIAAKTVNIIGGFNSDFSSLTGETSLIGDVIISDGVVNFDGINIQ